MPRKIAAIGKSSRLHCISQALLNSRHSPEVFLLSDVTNPRLAKDATGVDVGRSDVWQRVKEFVERVKPDLVIVGPEEPLAEGIVDKLIEMGIGCVGPVQKLAKLETSKSFTRELMSEYGIPGNPKYKIFHSLAGIADYLEELGEFVVKPDGLTGGKGVKVFGEHLLSIQEALRYCQESLETGSVVIEEKLDGEEFSYQSFFDGKHIAHTFPIQDHKRAKNGDTGLNTGGMGSYSCENHLLPFLSEADVLEAANINRRIGEALLEKTGLEYKGILYGGFMVTKNGLRVIEYNARFGDPEAMNVLSLLETDFLDICDAIVAGTLNQVNVTFRKMAAVCKYVVPNEYPGKSSSNDIIDISRLIEMERSEERLKVYFGAVEHDGHDYRLTGSRAVALVGIGTTLTEAERVAERAASAIDGPVYHRSDIGTQKLIQKRLDHMAQLNPHNEAYRFRYVG